MPASDSVVCNVSGQSASSTAAAVSYRLFGDGAQCGRYRIVRLLAKGGMSEVYEAVHRDLNKRVALKVLSPELSANAEARARFAAEAVNAASIWHTNVVDVTDYGTIHDLPYLVMNLLVGNNLAALFSRRGRLPVAELVDLLLPVACAVAAGHAQGIMHRDLKPENIFLHCEGPQIIPKLLDFGVSRMIGARRITVNANVFGTPHYMAPEQARGEVSTDPRADQYALGVILYEGLTGQLPRNADHPHTLLYTVAFGSFPPPSRYVQMPHELERVILRAMAREPNERFTTMLKLACALAPFASAATQAAWAVRLGIAKPLPPTAALPRVRPQLAPKRRSAPPPAPAAPRLPRTAAVLDVAGLLDAVQQRPRVVFTGLALSLLLLLASAWTLASPLDAVASLLGVMGAVSP